MFSLKKVSFLTYDTTDDIISSLEIKEKLLFPETDFWHDNYLTRRKIVEVILLNFRSNLGHKDKLEVI